MVESWENYFYFCIAFFFNLPTLTLGSRSPHFAQAGLKQYYHLSLLSLETLGKGHYVGSFETLKRKVGIRMWWCMPPTPAFKSEENLGYMESSR